MPTYNDSQDSANSLNTRELYLCPTQKPDKSNRSLPLTQRRALLIPLALGIVLLFGVVFSQQAFNLKQLRPDSAGQTLGLVALSALVFLLLVVLTFVLFRNLLKLYAERRLGVLGSRFRTRMMVGALVLSFAPAIVMFMFSYGLMNRSIDKWFSSPVNALHQGSGRVAALLTASQGDSARHTAMDIAESPEIQHAFETANYSGVLHEFRRHQNTLQNGFAVAIRDDAAVASWNLPRALADAAPIASRREQAAAVSGKMGLSKYRVSCGHGAGGKVRGDPDRTAAAQGFFSNAGADQPGPARL